MKKIALMFAVLALACLPSFALEPPQHPCEEGADCTIGWMLSDNTSTLSIDGWPTAAQMTNVTAGNYGVVRFHVASYDNDEFALRWHSLLTAYQPATIGDWPGYCNNDLCEILLEMSCGVRQSDGGGCRNDLVGPCYNACVPNSYNYYQSYDRSSSCNCVCEDGPLGSTLTVKCFNER